MSIFYLQSENDIYVLNATTKVTRSSPASLSNSIVEDGGFSSDNYVLRPVTVSFSGIITDISTFRGTSYDKGTEEYLKGLKQIQIDKKPLTVHYSDNQPPDVNCFFTNFMHTQDSENGRVKGGINSFKVDFTLQKVRYGLGAQSVARPSSVLSESVQPKTKKNSTTKSVPTGLNPDIVAGAKAIEEANRLQRSATQGIL